MVSKAWPIGSSNRSRAAKLHGGDEETILSNYSDMMYDHAYKEQLRRKATQKRQATPNAIITDQTSRWEETSQ